MQSNTPWGVAVVPNLEGLRQARPLSYVVLQQTQTNKIQIQKFKINRCDEYFMIGHRGETRGLGGIFFDDLNDKDPDTILAFSTEAVNTVVRIT